MEPGALPPYNSDTFSSENSNFLGFPGFAHKLEPPGNIRFVVIWDLFYNCTSRRGLDYIQVGPKPTGVGTDTL